MMTTMCLTMQLLLPRSTPRSFPLAHLGRLTASRWMRCTISSLARQCSPTGVASRRLVPSVQKRRSRPRSLPHASASASRGAEAWSRRISSKACSASSAMAQRSRAAAASFMSWLARSQQRGLASRTASMLSRFCKKTPQVPGTVRGTAPLHWQPCALRHGAT